MPQSDRTSLAHHVHEALSKLATANPDWPLYHAMSKSLGIDDDDELLFETLKLLCRSLRELKRQVEACPMLEQSRPVHLQNIEVWENLLAARSLHTPLNKRGDKPLDTHRVSSLLTLNDTLRWVYPKGRLKSSTEGLLSRRLERLLSDIEVSDLPQELKTFITTQLSTLAWALSNFEVLGADAVYEVVTGVAARTSAMAGKHSDAPPARNFRLYLKRFWRVLDAIERLNRGRAAAEDIWYSLFSSGGPALPPPGA